MIHSRRLGLIALGILLTASVALADGIIARKDGGIVSEREQHAFIEWSDGQERLYVRTIADSTDQPTVWLIPIPASPQQIKARPVERMPGVYQPIYPLPEARETLQKTGTLALLWDTGYAFSPAAWLFNAMNSNKTRVFSTADSAISTGGSGRPSEPLVVVHSHIEALGMVVEVLTAADPQSLNDYFRQKGLGIQAKQLTSLQSYFGTRSPTNRESFSFVCSWRAESPGTGRGVVIDFSSAAPFYPLLPTRANPKPVLTTVYLRGWFNVGPNVQIPGLTCHRLLARVVDPADDAALGREWAGSGLTSSQLDAVRLSPVTRINLSPNPGDWLQDLTLEPWSDTRENVAAWIARMSPLTLVVGSALLGILLSPIMLLFIHRRPRTGRDVWYTMLIGAGLAGTPILCGYFYVLWRHEEPAEGGTSWINSNPFSSWGMAVFLVAIPFWLFWFFCHLSQRVCWELLVLILAHLAAVTLLCHFLQEWFSVG